MAGEWGVPRAAAGAACDMHGAACSIVENVSTKPTNYSATSLSLVILEHILWMICHIVSETERAIYSPEVF